jgi:uncharacterized protein
MMRSLLHPIGAAVLGLAVLALAACASAPMHYYTLVAPATEARSGAIGGGPAFELLPVSIPAQDDQPQLVIRQGAQGVALLQNERWIAPLADEIRGALSADLTRELGGPDVTGLPHRKGPVLRIKVDVRRFDSQPGGYALLDAAWSVRPLGPQEAAGLACTSQLREPVGSGYEALVQGHQQALAGLARQLAEAGRALAAGHATCPAP